MFQLLLRRLNLAQPLVVLFKHAPRITPLASRKAAIWQMVFEKYIQSRTAAIPPTAVGGWLSINLLSRSSFHQIPPDGSRWIFKVLPSPSRRLDFKYPPTTVGGILEVALIFQPPIKAGSAHETSRLAVTTVEYQLLNRR